MELIQAVRIIQDKYATANVYMGIDPGASGAIAFLVDGRALVADIPTIKVNRKGGTKTEFNFTQIAKDLSDLPLTIRIMAVVEEGVAKIPGKGDNSYSAFRQGVAFGMWPAFFAALDISYERVHPMTWKSAMGLKGKGKEAARLKALALWPKADLGRKKDVDRAEAALMAEWFRRRCLGEENKHDRKRK